MGERGPIPKRSTERAGHRAKADKPDRVILDQAVRPPTASRTWAPEAKRWYRALKESGQARYFEPSDWEYARLLCKLLTDQLGEETVRCPECKAAFEHDECGTEAVRPRRASSEMVKAILSGMAQLGTTESDRRRMRIEVERPAQGASEDERKVTVLERYRSVATSS